MSVNRDRNNRAGEAKPASAHTHDVHAPGMGRRRWLQAVAAIGALIGRRVGAQQSNTSAPKITISDPPTGSTVSGLVYVAMNASDNVGVTRVELRVNGTLMSLRLTQPYVFNWDSTRFADGAATLTGTAYDAAGNTGSASINVTVSNGEPVAPLAPQVSITTPTAGNKVSGIVTIVIDAADNSAVSRVELRANSLLIGTSNSAPYRYSWDSRNVADGAATLMAWAFDIAGNRGTASINVTVENRDVARPGVAIIEPPSGSTVSGLVTVAVIASDNVGVAHVDLRANGALVGTRTTIPYRFEWDSAVVPNGVAALGAFAFDAAGNQVSATTSVTVANDPSAPAWYAALPVNAWSHLPVTTVNDEICTNANPTGIVWPSTGGDAYYDPTKPLVAGKHPIPGRSATTYNAFSGGRMIEDLSFVRAGVRYRGNYWVRFGGGHEGSPDNSLHAIGPFDGTPKRINITDPSIPPAIDLINDGKAEATWAPDGRPGAAEAFNCFAYIRSLNTLVIGQGAGYHYAVGVHYAYRFDEDGAAGGLPYPNAHGTYATPPTGWMNNVSFFDQSKIAPGQNTTQECAWMVDNVRGELWIVPLFTSTPLLVVAPLAQGGQLTYREVSNLDTISQDFYKKGWAVEGESWLVFMAEAEPRLWYVIDRDYVNQYGRLQLFPVTFTGDALPAAVGPQPTAGAAFDYEQRCFYVWSAGADPNVVAADVYKLAPPKDLRQPWLVTKITPVGGIRPEAPWGGLQWKAETGQTTNVGGWSAYGNFEFVPRPTRGLFYHHRLDVPPLFFRLR